MNNKRIFIIGICTILLFANKVCAQWFELHGTFSTPNVDQSIFSGGSNEALEQLNQRFYSAWAASRADYGRQIGRFDRKLAISSQVVSAMNTSFPNLSIPRAKYLYKRSVAEYKKLEELSQKAAQAAINNEDLAKYKQQQEEIIEKALHDYHKAEDLEELGKNKSKIIDEQAQAFAVQKNLTLEEKGELNTEIDKIKFAEAQIEKLNSFTDPLTKTARDLERKQLYQTVAQSIIFVSKIIEKTIDLINPTGKVTGEAVSLTQTMVEKYIEDTMEDGKSPEVAIRNAYLKVFQDVVRDDLLNKNDKIKQLSKVPLLIKDLADEIEKWDKIEKNQRAVIKKIDEVVAFSKDGVKRNQILIDQSTSKAKVIINKGVTRYLSRTQP
jgi:hypothetical protein